MSRYFSIEYNDLSYEKKEELLEEVRNQILEDWEEIGKGYLKDKKWYVPPKTWQEAFCRIETIDWEMWNDLDENDEEFQTYDWNYALEEYAEKHAENALYKSMHHLEIEVEL